MAEPKYKLGEIVYNKETKLIYEIVDITEEFDYMQWYVYKLKDLETNEELEYSYTQSGMETRFVSFESLEREITILQKNMNKLADKISDCSWLRYEMTTKLKSINKNSKR